MTAAAGPGPARTPARRKARQLAKYLRAERPDYAYLKEVFRHLREELGVEVARVPQKLPYVPTEAEIRAFYDGVWKARRASDVILIKTLLYTGVRVSELVRIRITDVDLDACRIRITQGKGGKDRVVPFPAFKAGDCPMSSCAAPAGSPCRTGRGRVAAQYHTARFRLVPRLAKALAVPVPPVRRPGSAWTELPRPAAAGTARAGHVRIGYARASTARQSLDTQTDSLKASGVTRIFAEKISTRAVTRPELDKAVALAREIRASGAAVTIVVHEHKRLGRGIELAALAEQLRAAGIGLEFLTGELQGSHDPSGVVFTVLAALSGMEREYIRDRTLEGHESARARGKSIGCAAVTDDAMLAAALHLRGQEMSLREIAGRLVIATGKKKGQHPSPAPVMRMLREHDEKTAAAVAAG